MSTRTIGFVGLTILLFFGLAAALVWLITQLIRGNQASTLATLPLAPEGEVRIETTGNFVVLLEVPRTVRDHRDFEIAVTERATENRTILKLNYLGARSKISGVSTVKIPYGTIVARQPGLFQVQVSPVVEKKDYGQYRLVFSRPYLARMVFQIVGIVICGVGMLLSVLGACWLLGLLKA